MPKNELLYVELKTGFDNDGPACIGRGVFSRTGSTLYFHGRALQKGQTAAGNFLDAESGEVYWVSGAKKNERNRLSGSRRPVGLDAAALAEYLRYIGRGQLPKSGYWVMELLPSSAICHHARQNRDR